MCELSAFWRDSALDAVASCAARSLEVVEFATLSWVHWFNTTWLLEPLGYLHPAEFEAQHYDTITPCVMQAVA